MILSAYSRGLVSLQTQFIRGSMAAVGLGFKAVIVHSYICLFIYIIKLLYRLQNMCYLSFSSISMYSLVRSVFCSEDTLWVVAFCVITWFSAFKRAVLNQVYSQKLK